MRKETEAEEEVITFEILSLFPDYFVGPFDESIIKQARKKGILEIRHVNIRDFADGKHQRVDDRPYGGGPGMVMMVEPCVRALRQCRRSDSHVVYLSPQGRPLTASKCGELAKKSHLILLCGHYEGIDERVMSEVDEEISIGDYVLTNGALAAIVLVDAVARFVPGVLGDEKGAYEDSFEKGILDHPHYTVPLDFEGRRVPEVLLSGHHEKIASWRRQEALAKTKRVRFDLYLSTVTELCERGEAKNAGVTLPVKDVKKASKFYEKVLNVRLNVIAGEKAEGIILSLVTAVEDFERIAVKVKRECSEVKIKNAEITFTDPSGYPWVLVKAQKREENDE